MVAESWGVYIYILYMYILTKYSGLAIVHPQSLTSLAPERSPVGWKMNFLLVQNAVFRGNFSGASCFPLYECRRSCNLPQLRCFLVV